MEATAGQNEAFERRLARVIVVSLALAGLVGVALLVPGSRNPEMGRALVVATVVGAALRPWRLRALALWGCSVAYFVAFFGVTVLARAPRTPAATLSRTSATRC